MLPINTAVKMCQNVNLKTLTSKTFKQLSQEKTAVKICQKLKMWAWRHWHRKTTSEYVSAGGVDVPQRLKLSQKMMEKTIRLFQGRKWSQEKWCWLVSLKTMTSNNNFQIIRTARRSPRTCTRTRRSPRRSGRPAGWPLRTRMNNIE